MRARRLVVAGGFEFSPDAHSDVRGSFVAPFQEDTFVGTVGHGLAVAQTNLTTSARGVVRGVHFTSTPPGQEKYVYCTHGRALDVMVDIRLGSPTFGAWDAVELEGGNGRAVYFPAGVGHAVLALEDATVMSYLVTTTYRAELEQAIDPFDEELGLPWPEGTGFVLSTRDEQAIGMAEARETGLLPRYADCVPEGSAR